MTPEQVKLVQDSFGKVVPIAGTAADLFYNRLFEIAPEVKPLFKGDLTEQKKKLIAMRATVSYGVQAKDYTPVGAALLWTLEKGLGEAWTKDVADAWVAAYTTLSGFMISEAYPKTQAAE